MTKQTPPAQTKPVALETRTATEDARLMSPSVARNKDIILDVLRPHLAPGMKVLEIASGTGEHAAHLVSNIEGLDLYPSDPSSEARTSIAAWARHLGKSNFRPALTLDTTSNEWPVEDWIEFDGILCINMVHIAPFAAAQGVVRGAGKHLRPGGFLYFYGPFKRDGAHTSASNEAFDEDLKSRDPSWGIRDVEEIETLASHDGLVLESLTQMPANNLSLVFRRQYFRC